MSRTAFRSERHFALDSNFPSESRRPAFYRPAPARPMNPWRRLMRLLYESLT